eukprot:760907-Hanusia_phi.AAC.4
MKSPNEASASLKDRKATCRQTHVRPRNEEVANVLFHPAASPTSCYPPCQTLTGLTSLKANFRREGKERKVTMMSELPMKDRELPVCSAARSFAASPSLHPPPLDSPQPMAGGTTKCSPGKIFLNSISTNPPQRTGNGEVVGDISYFCAHAAGVDATWRDCTAPSERFSSFSHTGDSRWHHGEYGPEKAPKFCEGDGKRIARDEEEAVSDKRDTKHRATT